MKENHVFHEEENPSKKVVIFDEELDNNDNIDGIENLEDLLKLVFIDEEYEKLKTVDWW